MSQPVKFYTDEHVANAVVLGLRQRGIDVLTVVEAKLAGATDEQHFKFAEKEERTIFTQDSDFLKLAANSKTHPGVVYAPQLTPVGKIIRGLVLISKVLDAGDMRNHVEFI